MDSIQALNMMGSKYALFGFFFAFHNRLQAAGDAFYEEITCKQFFLMACMNLFRDIPPTANDLAKVMGCTRQNVKEILTSLEKKSFISLVPDKVDKRKRRVVLTEKAAEFAEKYSHKETEFLERLYEGITEEEIRNIYLLLTKMEGNLITINEELQK